MRISTEVKHPALYYYGGKWLLAPWIIKHFPKHDNYLEPCMGACSVLLRKPRSRLETINDLDWEVVNFFKVLRERPRALIRYIQLTPWSRAEFELIKSRVSEESRSTMDSLELARRLYARLVMGRAASHSTGWQFVKNYHGCRTGRLAKARHLFAVAKRLQGVQIENRDAIEVIKDFDRQNTLIYFDPPYIAETRSSPEQYAYEVTDEWHAEAAAVLRQCKGYVVVSGYNCQLYQQLYGDWPRYDTEAWTSGNSKRTESIWLSPRTAEAIGKPKQPRLI